MIVFLSTRRHDYTIRRYLDDPAGAIADRFAIVAYEDALGADVGQLPAGTWIFTDYDRLPAAESAAAAALWRELRSRGCRTLNHPTRSLRRYALMRTLSADGINDYDAWPLDDLRPPPRWPVFLRRVDAHSGPASHLLPTRERLDRALAHVRRVGWPLDAFIAVEFCDTRDPDGLYRKFTALRIGAATFPFDVTAAPDWAVKYGRQGRWSAAHLEWEADFIERNPHAQQVTAIFDLAGVEYGRIDYGLRDGRIQVWEINSNPSFSGLTSRMAERARANRITNERIMTAFAALDAPTQPAP